MAASTGTRRALPALLFFIAIGFGYILVEISLIQRFVLFLGHPTYALTVVVFLMLLSSGAGSVIARRWITSPRARCWECLALIAAKITINLVLLPWISLCCWLSFFVEARDQRCLSWSRSAS